MKNQIKPLLFIGFLFLTVTMFCQDKKMQKPSELSKQFIADYKKWNDFAYKLDKSKDKKSDYAIEKMYDDLILKYCSPEKKYQALAFGSHSNHCPEQEQIISEKIESSQAIVKTKFTNEKFDFITHNYEYLFILLNGKWILEELYLVDDDGKYKSL